MSISSAAKSPSGAANDSGTANDRRGSALDSLRPGAPQPPLATQTSATGIANINVARQLREIADLLGQQGANRFRIEAYRRAGETVAALEQPVCERLADGGVPSLIVLPNIGSGLAAVIEDIVLHGESRLLLRLREGDDPERLFRTLPGIGSSLARRLHRDLGLETLADVERASYDGRLENTPGFGPQRLEALRAVLAARLGRKGQNRTRTLEVEPDVQLLLDVDRMYRQGAASGRFRRVAPQRFNPTREAWLPIAHISERGWHFTAMFSNTALAHSLGRTHDWVVLYYYDGDHREQQCTVVTEKRGPLAGQRVVRGREQECNPELWHSTKGDNR